MKRQSKEIRSIIAFVISVLVLLVTPFSVSAYDAEFVEGIFQYEVDEGEAILFGLTNPSYSGTVDIPSTLGGYSVRTIAVGAFKNCSHIQSVTIPSSVTWINENGFSNCSSLTSITLPVSVKSIHEGAFGGCSNLKDVYYTGSEQQKSAITINAGNQNLLNATWHCNGQKSTASEPTSKPASNPTTESSVPEQSQNSNTVNTQTTSKDPSPTESDPSNHQDVKTEETSDLTSRTEDSVTIAEPEIQDDKATDVTEDEPDSHQDNSRKTVIIILILVFCLMASIAVIVVLIVKNKSALKKGI